MMKKWLTCVIVTALSLSLLMGCGTAGAPQGTPENASGSAASGTAAPDTAESGAKDSDLPDGESGGLSPEAGTFPLTDEKITLTMMIQDASYYGPIEKNEFFKWYEDLTNVHIEFIEVEPAAMTERLNLMLVSGEYPDILMCSGVTPVQEVTYGSQGTFLALNDLIDKWGKETQDVFSLYDTLPGAITAPDGNIYSLPNINDCFHCDYGIKLWINQDWLNALSLDAPATTEEFREVLRAFKEQDPNGNGSADEISLMGASGWGEINPSCYLLNAFLYCPARMDMLYVDDNGKVACAAVQPEFREGLSYIKSLVDEGLLDATSYTQTKDQLKQFALDPEAVMLGAFPATNAVEIIGKYEATPDNRTMQYVPLAPLIGPNGYQNTPITGDAYYSGSAVITDACEYPEIAFRWLDGLFNEEVTMESQYGPENPESPDFPGRGVEEGDIGINGKPALWTKVKLPDTIEDIWRASNICIARRTSDLRLAQKVDYSDPDVAFADNEVRLYNATHDYYEPYAHAANNLSGLYLTEAESAEVAEISTTVSTYINEQMVGFILGTRNLDTEWDSYLKEFNAMNLDRLLEIEQAAYDLSRK